MSKETSKIDNAICGNCPAFHDLENRYDEGECRFYPPKADNRQDLRIVPKTKRYSWCLRHPERMKDFDRKSKEADNADA